VTVVALSHDDAIARAVRARDLFAAEASYWRRAGTGVDAIRRAILFEEQARDVEDLVAYLRLNRRPAEAAE